MEFEDTQTEVEWFWGMLVLCNSVWIWKQFANRIQPLIVIDVCSHFYLLLSDAFHKNVSKAARRAQSQLDVEKPHWVEDILKMNS